MTALGLGFFLAALCYSAVGFGGGSTYIALLALAGVSHLYIPALALLCNLVVVSGNTYLFSKANHLCLREAWPYVATSIPLAFLGGLWPLSEATFFWLLGISLAVVALKLILLDRRNFAEVKVRKLKTRWKLTVGGAVGLLSGMIGIGGGIFLAPILLLGRWALPKQIAAMASFFILVNSLAAFLGHLIKLGWTLPWTLYFILPLVVFFGGQIGARLGSGGILSQRFVKDGTAVLVLAVALRIIWGNFQT